jgi:hypothetical protein
MSNDQIPWTVVAIRLLAYGMLMIALVAACLMHTGAI